MSFVEKLRSATRAFVPSPLRQMAREYLSSRWEHKYEGRPVEEIFSAVYAERKWGTESESDFSSGTGSHDNDVVSPYVTTVRQFLESQPSPPSVVDLGCGDFHVGQQLRPYCGRYIACDVVSELIQRNKNTFVNAQVDFRRLDIIDGDLPEGDIVFLRQVLQHLNNTQILRVVNKLYRYRFLILTEHLPVSPDFPPNLDKKTGGRIRLPQGSGVVLTAPPFGLTAKKETLICATRQSIDGHEGVIKTILYQL